MNFKLEDRVRIRKTSNFYRADGNDPGNPIDQIGTIIHIYSGGGLNTRVQWKGFMNSYNDQDLELVSEKELHNVINDNYEL